MSTCVPPNQCPARVRIIYRKKWAERPFRSCFYWIAPITAALPCPLPQIRIPDQWVRVWQGPEMHILEPQLRVRKHTSKKVWTLSYMWSACLQVQGTWRECPRAGRFWASLLLHTTCMRSWCNWRASCVAAWLLKIRNRTFPFTIFFTAGSLKFLVSILAVWRGERMLASQGLKRLERVLDAGKFGDENILKILV